MENLLKTMQEAWDKVDAEGRLSDSFKETHHRPETIEDVQKLIGTIYNPKDATKGLVILLLFMLLFNP